MMIIDKEEHRALLAMAVTNLPISGPAGDPEMLRNVTMVHEILASIAGAAIAIDPALDAMTDR